MNATDIPRIPAGCLLEMRRLDAADGPVEWFRVIDKDGRILGSGFDRSEAAVQAWRELERRGKR